MKNAANVIRGLISRQSTIDWKKYAKDWPFTLSLAAAGLMFALPYLNPRHYYPLPGFYAEFAAALLLFIAGAACLVPRESWGRLFIPSITLLPLGLATIALLQQVFGYGGTDETRSLFLLYMVGAGFAMVTGQILTQKFGLPVLVRALATCLLVGALISALLSILSLYVPLLVPWGLVEVTLPSQHARGNLMQQNHLAHYLWAGIMSAGFLYLAGRLSKRWLLAALIPLLLVTAMTGSKAVLVYIAGTIALALLWRYRSRTFVEARRSLWLALWLAIGFFAAQEIMQYLPVPSFQYTGAREAKVGDERMVSGSERLSDDLADVFGGNRETTGSVIRKIHAIKIAFAMFQESPIIGGVGNFPWKSFVLAEKFPSDFQGHTEHAHNLFAQLLAELGLAGLILFIACIALWWRRFAQLKWSAAHVWLIALLMIDLVHSLLEYPLWYTYFLLPAALLMGAADTRAFVVRPGITLRSAVFAFLLLGAAVLYILQADYRKLEHALNPGLVKRTSLPTFGELNPMLLDLEKYSLFAPYVRLLYAASLAPTRDLMAEKLIMTESAMHLSPLPQVVFKHAMLLALAGRQEEALQQLRWSMHGYPKLVPQFLELLKTRQAKDATLPYAPLIQAAESGMGRTGVVPDMISVH